ncbi:MAG: hypothetical protein AAB403_12625 [Planctomycetota bacterium]
MLEDYELSANGKGPGKANDGIKATAEDMHDGWDHQAYQGVDSSRSR